MQTQNFRSSRELGISPKQYLALTKVLSVLERGLIRWVNLEKLWDKQDSYYCRSPRKAYRGYFNANAVGEAFFPYGPIAGPVELFQWVGGLNKADAENLYEWRLCFHGELERAELVKPEWFAKGIREWLETDAGPHWKKIVPRHVVYKTTKRDRIAREARQHEHNTKIAEKHLEAARKGEPIDPFEYLLPLDL